MAASGARVLPNPPVAAPAALGNLPSLERPNRLAPLGMAPGMAPVGSLPNSPVGGVPAVGTPRGTPRTGGGGYSTRLQPDLGDDSSNGPGTLNAKPLGAAVPLGRLPAAGSSQQDSQSQPGASSTQRKSSAATQAAYRRIAQERCEEAMAKAKQIAKHREKRGLPPGVWWGFHWFWPPELLKPKINDPLEDPEFLRKVFRLMNDETVVDTFAIFDQVRGKMMTERKRTHARDQMARRTPSWPAPSRRPSASLHPQPAATPAVSAIGSFSSFSTSSHAHALVGAHPHPKPVLTMAAR